MNLGVSTDVSTLTTLITDLLAVIVPKTGWEDGLKELDAAFEGQLSGLAKASGFEGKAGQSFRVHALNRISAGQVVLIGAGDDALSSDRVKEIGGHIAQAGFDGKASRVAISTNWSAPMWGTVGAGHALSLVAEGVQLGCYRFERYLSEKPRSARPESVVFVTDIEGSAGSLKRARAVADGTIAARNLVNEPPNVCTPVFMARFAATVAKDHGMALTIMDEAQMEEKGLNLLLAVGRGSIEESRLIHLTYEGAGPIERTLAFVGKGVTFDTGGYSLKPTAGMMNMHCDMGGGAAVLGAAVSIGALAPAGVRIHFIVPSTTNRVSRDAYTVNEVIKGYGGKTVEINNTDAEGRLLLADALAYAAELGVDEIIDLATLTGACVVALGEQYSALFSNDDAMAGRVLEASKHSGDRIWHMPLDEKLRDKLKSPVADMRNTGDRWGGAITAALFLKEWVKDVTWSHLDIAGPAIVEAETPLSQKGGSGAGVAALVSYAGV